MATPSAAALPPPHFSAENMPKSSGISSQTVKGLIDSGAMSREDFYLSREPDVPLPKIARDPTRQVTQSEYKKQFKEQRKKADAAYDAWQKGGKK